MWGFFSTFTSENFYNENISVTIDFTGFSGYPGFACRVVQFAAISFTANIPSKKMQLPEFQIKIMVWQSEISCPFHRGAFIL